MKKILKVLRLKMRFFLTFFKINFLNKDISINSEDDINQQKQQQSKQSQENKEEDNKLQENQQVHLQNNNQLSVNNRTIISLNGTDSFPSSETEQQLQPQTPSGILSMHSTTFDQQQFKVYFCFYFLMGLLRCFLEIYLKIFWRFKVFNLLVPIFSFYFIV